MDTIYWEITLVKSQQKLHISTSGDWWDDHNKMPFVPENIYTVPKGHNIYT